MRIHYDQMSQSLIIPSQLKGTCHNGSCYADFLTTANLLELRNVSIIHGSGIALKNLSLTIGEGEHVAILGPNGCGKSTLIKTITRECYPLALPVSSIRIYGESFWDVTDLRAMFGIMSNDLMEKCTRPIT